MSAESVPLYLRTNQSQLEEQKERRDEPHVEERVDLNPLRRETLSFELLVDLHAEHFHPHLQSILRTLVTPRLGTRFLSLENAARPTRSAVRREGASEEDVPFCESHTVRTEDGGIAMNENRLDPQRPCDRTAMLPSRSSKARKNVSRGVVPSRLRQAPNRARHGLVRHFDESAFVGISART